jgi:hypothetical protein
MISLTIMSCHGRCDCVAPIWEPLGFEIVDSAGSDILDSLTKVNNFYYLRDGNKIPVSDLTLSKTNYGTIGGDTAYFFQSDEAAKNSVDGIKESYIELVPGDIDTIFLEAVNEDNMHRFVREVKFNGVSCTKDPKHTFIWQIPKNMKK